MNTFVLPLVGQQRVIKKPDPQEFGHLWLWYGLVSAPEKWNLRLFKKHKEKGQRWEKVEEATRTERDDGWCFYDISIWVFPKIGGFYPPKWMVKKMKNPMNPWMIWGEFSHYFRFNIHIFLVAPKISSRRPQPCRWGFPPQYWKAQFWCQFCRSGSPVALEKASSWDVLCFFCISIHK